MARRIMGGLPIDIVEMPGRPLRGGAATPVIILPDDYAGRRMDHVAIPVRLLPTGARAMIGGATLRVRVIDAATAKIRGGHVMPMVIIEDQRTVVTHFVYDTFTDIDFTSLDAHTPDIDALGGGWIEDIANWDIFGNWAWATAVNHGTAHIVTTMSDGYVEAECEIFGGDHIGIICRKSVDGGVGANEWELRINAQAGNDWLITEVNNGARINRVMGDCDAHVAGVPVRVTGHLNGTTINMWTHGVYRGQFVSVFNQAAVWHGLYNHLHANQRFDEFYVTSQALV